jgi:hypothetical protein
MAELWESQVAIETEPEAEAEMEQETEMNSSEETREPAALTVSVDDFAALEERVLRAVTLVKQERQARLVAEERAAQAEAQLHDQAPRLDQMGTELAALKVERDHVRQRVERLLQQLDALEI